LATVISIRGEEMAPDQEPQSDVGAEPAVAIAPPPPNPVPAAPSKRGKAISDMVGAAAARLLPTLLMLVLFLGAWQISCQDEGSSLPSPSRIWTESHEVIVHPLKGVTFDAQGMHIDETGDVGVGGHILTSLQRVGYGFGLSVIFGVAFGILIGQSVFAYRALDPLFQILRTVPPLAWLPISLAIFQQAGPSAVFLIFITAIWPIILNTAAGVQNIPATYRNVGRVLALSPIEYFRKIMLPATVPHMFTGLRIGIGMSWLAIVAAEMVQGGTGIGFFIWDSYNSSLLTDTIVALIWIGLVGFTLDRIVGFIGNRVARQA
jgi:nitrate/nitrite transport system permease protein